MKQLDNTLNTHIHHTWCRGRFSPKHKSDAVYCYLMSPFFLTHRSPVSSVAVSSSPPVVAVAPRVQKLHSVTASSMAPLPAPVSISSPSASN